MTEYVMCSKSIINVASWLAIATHVAFKFIKSNYM